MEKFNTESINHVLSSEKISRLKTLLKKPVDREREYFLGENKIVVNHIISNNIKVFELDDTWSFIIDTENGIWSTYDKTDMPSNLRQYL